MYLSKSFACEHREDVAPVYLTELLAREYPEELLKVIAGFDDSLAKEVLYGVAIMSLLSPEDVILDEASKKYLNERSNIIATCDGCKRILFKLYVKNNIVIDRLDSFDFTSDDVSENIDAIRLELNQYNIKTIKSDTLIEYLSKNNMSTKDFKGVMRYAAVPVKRYLASTVSERVSDDAAQDCYSDAAKFVVRDGLSLGFESVIQYCNKIGEDLLIGIICASKDLSADDIVKVMTESGDANLEKISRPGSRITFRDKEKYIEFASKLESLGLVKRWNSKNNLVLRVVDRKAT